MENDVKSMLQEVIERPELPENAAKRQREEIRRIFRSLLRKISRVLIFMWQARRRRRKFLFRRW